MFYFKATGSKATYTKQNILAYTQVRLGGIGARDLFTARIPTQVARPLSADDFCSRHRGRCPARDGCVDGRCEYVCVYM